MHALAEMSDGLSAVATLLLQDSYACSSLSSVPGYLPCGLNTGKIRTTETRESRKTLRNQVPILSTNETGQLIVLHAVPQNSLQLTADGFSKMIPGLT